MNTESGVIIMGGDFQGLAALRSLSRRNIPVLIIDHDHCISRYSRCRHRFVKSPASSDHDAYLDFLIKLADKENVRNWLIIPNSDETVYILSMNKARLTPLYRVATPSWDVIKNIYIKKNTYELAKKLNIPIPTSHFPSSIQEVEELDIRYPVVIKPSIRDNLYPKVHVKAYRINNKQELIKTYRYVSQFIDPSEIIVQDLIPGGAEVLYSFCPFFKNGTILTSITARRPRQHPMTFGHASTFAELVHIPKLKEMAEQILQAIDYYGFGEVEFMYDKRDNTYRFLEINPRIWGWHSLAIAAGADYPAMLYMDVFNQPFEIPRSKETMKWIRLTTDIPTALGEIIKGRLHVRDYLSSMRGDKTFAVFSKHDPLPFFAELFMLPYLAIKRGF